MGIEHGIQTACVRWFRMQYPQYWRLFFAVPNGAKRSRWQAAQAKEEGMLPGVADTILLVPSSGHHGLCVEFKYEEVTYVKGLKKTHRTYQSLEQKEWERDVTVQGYRYVVVRSFEEFRRIITEYLNGKD